MTFDAQLLVEHLNQEEAASDGNHNRELAQMNHKSVVHFSVGT